MQKTYSGFRAAIVATGLMILTGCASIDLAGKSAVSPGKRVVFGQITVMDGDKTYHNWDKIAGLFDGDFYVSILPNHSNKVTKYFLKGDGFFCWQLPPGEYVVSGWTLIKTGFLGETKYSDRVFAGFTVSDASPGVYIGNLLIQMKATPSAVSVADESVGATKRLQTTFKGPIEGEISKNLMQLEKRR